MGICGEERLLKLSELFHVSAVCGNRVCAMYTFSRSLCEGFDKSGGRNDPRWVLRSVNLKLLTVCCHFDILQEYYRK